MAVLGTPAVTLTCTGSGAGTTTCTQTTGTAMSFTANVGANSTTLTSATLEFGDGMSTALGGLSAATTVSHSYASVGTFTATLRGTDVNGQVTNASVAITITAPAPVVPIGVTLTATSTPADPAAIVGNGQRFTFTVTVTPATDATLVESYTWDFGDGTSAVTTGNTSHVYTGPTNNGRAIVTVTVRTSDGRSATGRTEIIVSGLL